MYFFKSHDFPGQSYEDLPEAGRELVQEFCRQGLPVYQVDGDSGSNPDPAAGVCALNSSTRQLSTDVPGSNLDNEKAIRSLLNDWVESFKQKDLAKQVACYASQLDLYYQKHDASQAFVEADKARALAAIARIETFQISDINISFNTVDEASVTFDKTWDTILNSGRRYAGSEKERIKVAEFEGRWRIKSEEEVMIYHVTR